jgi:hypothetical protein
MKVLESCEDLLCLELHIHLHFHSVSGKSHIATGLNQVISCNKDLHKLHNCGNDEDHAVIFEDLEKSLSQEKIMPQSPNLEHLLVSFASRPNNKMSRAQVQLKIATLM